MKTQPAKQEPPKRGKGKAGKKAEKKSTCPNTRVRGPRRLTVRQERFCEFIAAGESGVSAWIKAGYNVDRMHARVQASECQAKPHIAARIAELRKPERAEMAMSKQYKREVLQRITASEGTSTMAKIRAIEVDAKLAGHFEPDRVEVETGPKTLDAIRERAERVASALDRNHQIKASRHEYGTNGKNGTNGTNGKCDAQKPSHLSRWIPSQ